MLPRIELAPRAEQAPLTEMLATLLRQNLDARPEKLRAFLCLRGRVAIVVTDLQQALTLCFERGRLRIHSGIVGIPDVTIRTDYESVMKMSLVEIDPRTGLPNPQGEGAREVFRRSAKGVIEVRGDVGHIPLLLRLTNVMSVAP